MVGFSDGLCGLCRMIACDVTAKTGDAAPTPHGRENDLSERSVRQPCVLHSCVSSFVMILQLLYFRERPALVDK
jgi:hypothetical protein